MARLWDKGQPLDALIEAYTVGEDPVLDQRLLPFDVRGSKAHARMLRTIDVLDDAELTSLLQGLDEALAAWGAGDFTISIAQEDVHTALEQFLTERVGDVGKKVHTGRSRNDQVLVALALWQRDAVETLRDALEQAIAAFDDFASENEQVWEVTRRFGDRTFEGPDQDLVKAWRERLRILEQAPPEPRHAETWRRQSPLYGGPLPGSAGEGR